MLPELSFLDCRLIGEFASCYGVNLADRERVGCRGFGAGCRFTESRLRLREASCREQATGRKYRSWRRLDPGELELHNGKGRHHNVMRP